ncbi:MAG TPA: type II toxin-antitoxin system RelE/ParE family toxin [Blastocatellia bacterium]|nr:type II toxin-antitoxin system RelE/ParE family toxin [Blastocatellia bacterium]
MRVEYHPLTTSDLNNAVAFYNRQQAGLGDELRTEIYASIERVLASPTQFSIVSKGIRRCLAHRFPYAILFRVISEETLRVLVIRHHRRHSSFGLRRR